MTAVLVAIVASANRIIDSGSGTVIAASTHATAGGAQPVETVSYVLTCNHNLKALGRAVNGSSSSLKLLVRGKEATDIGQEELKNLDLTILAVKGSVGPAAKLISAQGVQTEIHLKGFVDFFGTQCEERCVKCTAAEPVNAVMPDGTAVTYLRLKPKPRSADFDRGMSGAPVFDKDGNAIAIGRILERKKINTKTDETESFAYAVKFDANILSLIERSLPDGLTVFDVEQPLQECDPERPTKRPDPPPPKQGSLDANDIQKNRWGGESKGFGRELTITNVEKYSDTFAFDAVLVSTDKSELKPPVVFHLHDTFSRSVITVHNTSGRKATLKRVVSEGTFTVGVQFTDREGIWRSLEYDLSDYGRKRGGRGELEEYD